MEEQRKPDHADAERNKHAEKEYGIHSSGKAHLHA